MVPALNYAEVRWRFPLSVPYTMISPAGTKIRFNGATGRGFMTFYPSPSYSVLTGLVAVPELIIRPLDTPRLP